MVEVLNNRNLFKKSNLVNSFSSYVQFCSGGHFSERSEAAWKCGKIITLNIVFICMQNTSMPHTDAGLTPKVSGNS